MAKQRQQERKLAMALTARHEELLAESKAVQQMTTPKMQLASVPLIHFGSRKEPKALFTWVATDHRTHTQSCIFNFQF